MTSAGETYYEFRANLMIESNEGLTKTYNRFHDPHEQSEGILELRRLPRLAVESPDVPVHGLKARVGVLRPDHVSVVRTRRYLCSRVFDRSEHLHCPTARGS